MDNVTKTISGHNATLLTDLGREQAESLGKVLSDMSLDIDVVYSSDLKRASETTSIVCNQLGIEEIRYDKRLREGDAGVFTGRRGDDLTDEEREFYDSLIVHLDRKVPGGESVNEQFVRTREAFLEIVALHPEDTTILLVGHGGTLYHILKRTVDVLPDTDEWFGNCKLQILERNSVEDPWKLSMFNGRPL
jgi:probable phosphoglycerate mutase